MLRDLNHVYSTCRVYWPMMSTIEQISAVPILVCVFNVDFAGDHWHSRRVGSCRPKIGNKFLPGKYVKFWHFLNFSYMYFPGKNVLPLWRWQLLRLSKWHYWQYGCVEHFFLFWIRCSQTCNEYTATVDFTVLIISTWRDSVLLIKHLFVQCRH